MNTTPVPSDLHRLFVAKADGRITPEDHERLAGILRESAAARRQWYAFQDVESALFDWSQREMEQMEKEPALAVAGSMAGRKDIRPRSRQRAGWWGLLAAAAVLGLTASVLQLLQTRDGSPVVAQRDRAVVEEEATTTTVALLTRGVNLEWEGGVDAPAPALNSPLSPGWLRLKAGVAELEFFQGARLRVEGPAEIRLVSASEAYCVKGRFSAHVPPQAKGFRLGTPNGDIVDLGTDFGLDLNSPTPEVHVFKGEVELHQPEAQVRMLTEGQAAGFDSVSAARVLAANDSAFGFSKDLDARMNASQKEAFAGWELRGEELSRDPRLRLRLDFQDQMGSRSLMNTAAAGQEIAAGTIVGCIWTQGRWPEKRALQFRSLSDRVRLSIPGEHPQITLATWVQLHGLNVRQSSICMSEGIEAGYMHWQVLHDGSLCLGVGGGTRPEIKWEDFISPIIFTPERFGQWVHLAVVYDSKGGEVTFYLNGSPLSRHPVKNAIKLTPGIVELGNWTPSPDRLQQPVRNFAGCMDEFTLHSAALGPDEIRQLAAP